MFKKKALSTLLALTMCVGMLSTGAPALAAGTGEPDPAGVELSKTATALNPENETTVTLSIGASQETVAADVVFVLDKSTSDDVRNAAVAMLEELKVKAETDDLTVKVGVVVFNNNAETALGLTDLTTGFDQIKEMMATKPESGTNIEAGIRAGMGMLEQDTSVPDGDKHLVLVTDGVAYLWGTPTMTMWNWTPHGDNPNGLIWFSNSIASAAASKKPIFKINSEDYINSFADPATWMEANGIAIQQAIDEYGIAYGVKEGDTGFKYISASLETEEYSVYEANDAAMYMVGKAWQDAAEAGYQLYAFGSEKYNNTPINKEGNYPWASKFIGNLNKIGGVSGTYDEGDQNFSATGMFDGVKNSVLYEIQKGTVTDVIGSRFDLVNTDTITLTLDGEKIARDATSQGDSITFDGGKYAVGYNSDTETITWQINTPVAAGTKLALSYVLKVDPEQMPTGGESVKAPTNESAVLKYTSTEDSTEKEAEFEKPVLDLTSKKWSEPSLVKTVDGKNTIGTVAPGQMLEFTLTSNVGEDMLSCKKTDGTWDTYKLVFTDTMSDNLMFREITSVKVKDTELGEGDYTLALQEKDPVNGAHGGFILAIDCTTLMDKVGLVATDMGTAPVVITYKASVIGTALDGEQLWNKASVNGSVDSEVIGDVSTTKPDDPKPPVTGGPGTVAFTLLGGAMMCGAAALYITGRKKKGEEA